MNSLSTSDAILKTLESNLEYLHRLNTEQFVSGVSMFLDLNTRDIRQALQTRIVSYVVSSKGFV